MCWCLRVYWTVLNNLFARFFNNLANTFYNNPSYCGGCGCCWCCYDCCTKCKQKRYAATRGSEPLNEFVVPGTNINTLERVTSQSLNHDYVIVDDIDANYVEIERRKIETEPYYRTVDRKTAEYILYEREDGACLVRPFKEADISIKYIISVYAADQQYFHLFIRQINGKELFGIGQAKPNERLFNTPNEIVDFYSFHPLLCSNKATSISLRLKPIIT